MVFVPRYEYDTGPTLLELSISQRPWIVSSPSIGGRETAAGGLPVAFIIRRDHLLTQNIRFFEEEWPAVVAMLDWAQRAPNTVTVYLDRDELGTSYECYLEAPVMGEEIAPAREAGSDFVYTLGLIWRKVDGSVWADVYHEAD